MYGSGLFGGGFLQNELNLEFPTKSTPSGFCASHPGSLDRFPVGLTHRRHCRLDPKSGPPDFGIKLSKSETSDFDAIRYPRLVVPDRAAKPGGDDSGPK